MVFHAWEFYFRFPIGLCLGSEAPDSSQIAMLRLVRKTNGQIVSIFIPTTAKIERNDFKTALSAFKVNEAVQARFAANGTTVIKFKGLGPRSHLK
jgi:hypothetical protein